MRELHSWDGDRRPATDTGADTPIAHAHQSPNLEILRDREVRIAKHLEYQRIVKAAQVRDAAGQLTPEAAKPEQAPLEARDSLRGKIAERREPIEEQKQKLLKPERSRLPSNETAQLIAGLGIAVSSVADAANVLPGRWEAVAGSVVGAAVASIAWANKRWKDKHGNRPED